MKKLICCTIIAFFATMAVSIAGPNEDTIIAKEKAAWQAFKDKKADDFKKLISADLVAVYAGGMLNLEDELGAMSKTDMKSFSLSDLKVVMLGGDTAIISYKATLDTITEGEKDTSGQFNCASVWKKQNGEWRGVFHTEMKQEAAASQ